MYWIGRPATTTRSGGQLLPGRVGERPHAAVLRRTVPDGRDQLHLLPHADLEGDRRLGRRHTRSVPLHAESLQADHPHQEAPRVRGGAGGVLPACRGARAEAGALLFQLPPTFKKDLAVLDAFLQRMPRAARAAFEFRHPSWHDAEVNACLTAHHAAFCVADSDRMSTPPAVTAPFAYFRLRDEGYQDEDLVRWAADIRERTSGCERRLRVLQARRAGCGPGVRGSPSRVAGGRGLAVAGGPSTASAAKRTTASSAQYPSPPAARARRAEMNPQCPPWRVTSSVRCGLPRTSGDRNGSTGMNGSSSAVMISVGLRMRPITRSELAR